MTATLGSLIDCIARLSTREETKAPAITAITFVVAVTMALIHLAQAYDFVFPSGQFKNLHIGFAVLLTYLMLIERTPREKVWARRLLVLLALLIIAPTVYIHIEYENLVNVRSFKPNALDTTFALLLLGLTLYAAAREWGWVIPILAVSTLFYGYYGYLLPGELFSHGGIVLWRLIGYTSIPYFQGLLGGLTELSAGTIYMFMLFAGVLKITGGIDFIIKVAFSVGGRSRAGPAQVAVVSSGFLAMISGSVVANVASTGAMTIPMMKRCGFRPEFAGAVEAVASTGGQLTPPVMGLAAFLIVGITGIPYVEVMAAAVLPAVIYYAYLMLAVHVQALRLGLDARKIDLAAGHDETMSKAAEMTLAAACKEYGHLLFGIAVLVYFLVISMPPGTAVLYAIAMLLVMDGLKRLYRHRRQPLVGLRDVGRMILQSLEAGARSGAQVATIIAVCAILIDFLSVTGFAQKLSLLMLDLAGGNLWILMFIAALTCLAFGLGMPTTASYILVALLGAPALVELGLPLLAAHMYVFFFANVSALTPPVAIAALVASNIAGGRFMHTALLSVRLGLPGFLLPVVFALRPELLGLTGTLSDQIWVFAVTLVAVGALNLVFEGYFLTRMAWWERAVLIPAAAALLLPGWWTAGAGAMMFLAIAGHQVFVSRGYRASRKSNPSL